MISLPDLSCLANPWACYWSWLDGLPFLYVLLSGVAVGMVLGAVLGRIGVAAVLTLAAGFLVWRKVEGDDPDYETGEPASLQKTQTSPPKKRRTLQDIFGWR